MRKSGQHGESERGEREECRERSVEKGDESAERHENNGEDQ